MTMATAVLNGRAHTGVMTDDDIDPAARPRQRSFSAEYKAGIVAEYDSHPRGSDERGAILHREGLHSSHISEWRKQAEAGARQGLAAESKKCRLAGRTYMRIHEPVCSGASCGYRVVVSIERCCWMNCAWEARARWHMSSSMSIG